jgi:hypothetical protein
MLTACRDPGIIPRQQPDAEWYSANKPRWERELCGEGEPAGKEKELRWACRRRLAGYHGVLRVHSLSTATRALRLALLRTAHLGCASQQPLSAWACCSLVCRSKDVWVNNQKVTIRYNDTCHFYQPPRAHHCSMNDNCIERFDHHCPWVGTTIGLVSQGRRPPACAAGTCSCRVWLACAAGMCRKRVAAHTAAPRAREEAGRVDREQPREQLAPRPAPVRRRSATTAHSCSSCTAPPCCACTCSACARPCCS